ncbi:hypothetical protein Baya_0956 [Bagarius yarrelli]|uniref:Uncharacterized protein n=1 Tax=Bagarius yarrelli TaxID=175774 RepID=A0A556TJQ5_BAGYA|nr:hypothetical protein Baya_0956 [Bagarius yarrelli]
MNSACRTARCVQDHQRTPTAAPILEDGQHLSVLIGIQSSARLFTERADIKQNHLDDDEEVSVCMWSSHGDEGKVEVVTVLDTSLEYFTIRINIKL